MKITLRSIHKFVTSLLLREILKKYVGKQILNESDLQFEVRSLFRQFLERDKRLTIHGCISCSDANVGRKTFPDLLIVKSGEPWIVIELKEQGSVRQATVTRESEKIRAQLLFMGKSAKRGYFIYVSRRGNRLPSRIAQGVYEIPITLSAAGWESDQIKKFKTEFYRKSRRAFGLKKV
jgi:hypothetical protein